MGDLPPLPPPPPPSPVVVVLARLMRCPALLGERREARSVSEGWGLPSNPPPPPPPPLRQGEEEEGGWLSSSPVREGEEGGWRKEWWGSSVERGSTRMDMGLARREEVSG